MLNLAISVILFIGFLVGLKRGFILQVIHLTGFVIAFIVAYMYYEELAEKILLWIPYPSFGDESAIQFLFNSVNLENAYYRAIAFVMIFFAVKILLQIIGSMLDFVANLPILKSLNLWGGAILGFLEVYLVLFIILYIAFLLPIEQLQTILNESGLAKGIVEHTPYFSSKIYHLWIEYLGS